VQIVGYDTGTADDDGRDPALWMAGEAGVTARDGAARPVDRVSLTTETKLSYALGERRCAGVVDGDRHHACVNDDAPYCDAHTRTWVCARCTGTCLKDEMDCFDDHAVYLAAFAPSTFKVGVTKHYRLRTRLREQGADRAAHVHTVSNGRIARELEAEIADEVPDRVGVPTKIEGFADRVDTDAWTALLAGFDPIETFEFDYGLDLEHRPLTTTCASGAVRGVKGRVLVLDRGETAYAVDCRDLVGHVVREGDPGRDRQSSLGAFG
jgi:hypothetical protein